MKIGVFAYNFEHKKTQEGLVNLFLSGQRVSVIFAADPVELKFYQSKLRVTPKEIKYFHPRDIAKKLNAPYHVVKHNSDRCEELIRKSKLDLGIILGARILKENIINAFKIGVLNLHPGLLPKNRGLDNLKWAILNGYKQGVSSHLISAEIDKGKLIVQESIDVYEDDTFLDIYLRLQSKEQELMLDSIKILKTGKRNFKSVPEGNYFKSVPAEQEKDLEKTFVKYKRNYHNLK